MRWIGRTLIAIVLLALLGFAAYFTYTYLLPRWAAISFFTYLILGLIIMTFGIFRLRGRLEITESAKDFWIGSFQRAQFERSFVATVRRIATETTDGLVSILVWPIDFVSGFAPELRDESPRRFLTILSIRLQEYQHALFAAGFILAAYALGLVGVTGKGYGKLFVILMILSVVMRHVKYSIEAEGLPARLRRVAGSPYLLFLTIILVDFLSLVLGFALIKNGKTPSDVGLQDLESTAEGLYRFRELSRLLVGVRLSFIEIAIGTGGLLFYLALLRIALRYKDFRRKDEDHIWLARRHNSLGNFTIAMRHLDNVKVKTEDSDETRMISLLGVNQIDRALEKIRILMQQRGQQPSEENALLALLELCALAPIPEDVAESLFALTIEHKASDVRLQDSAQIVMIAYPGIVNKLEPHLASQKSNYPLTYAELLLATDQHAAALEIIERASPGTELEEIVRVVKRLKATLANPDTTPEQDAEAFREWGSSDLPIVRSSLSGLTRAQEKAMAFGQLNFALLAAEMFGKEREQEITFLLDDLKAQAGEDPLAEFAMKAMVVRVQAIREKLMHP